MLSLARTLVVFGEKLFNLGDILIALKRYYHRIDTHKSVVLIVKVLYELLSMLIMINSSGRYRYYILTLCTSIFIQLI